MLKSIMALTAAASIAAPAAAETVCGPFVVDWPEVRVVARGEVQSVYFCVGDPAYMPQSRALQCVETAASRAADPLDRTGNYSALGFELDKNTVTQAWGNYIDGMHQVAVSQCP